MLLSGQKRQFYATTYDGPTVEDGPELEGDLEGGEDCSPGGSQLEKKRRLTFDQVRSLEKNFEMENKLEPERKMQLAKELGLRPRQVAVWFQNRRARWKTKQLERDYEALAQDYKRLKADYDQVLADKNNLRAEVSTGGQSFLKFLRNHLHFCFVSLTLFFARTPCSSFSVAPFAASTLVRRVHPGRGVVSTARKSERQLRSGLGPPREGIPQRGRHPREREHRRREFFRKFELQRRARRGESAHNRQQLPVANLRPQRRLHLPAQPGRVLPAGMLLHAARRARQHPHQAGRSQRDHHLRGQLV